MKPSPPIRTCIGCQKREQQTNLHRVVADEAGRIRIDGARRQMGRGAYLHHDLRCVEEMIKRGALARSLKRKIVPVDASELWNRIEMAKTETRGQKS